MKRILVLFVSACITLTLHAEVPKTVDLTAGGLFSSLTALEQSTITKLILNGTIDARDFKIMRDNMPMLDHLDISGASISAYSGPDGTYYGGYSTSYPANTVPDYAFFYPWSGIAKTSLVSIQLPTSCTAIGTQSFQNCTGLTSLDLSSLSAFTSIANSAFQSCTSLTSVLLPASLTNLGSSAFYSCTGLTSLSFSIPSSLTSIGSYAFYSCSGLTSITLPSSITTIGDQAFISCTGLTSLNLPSSLTAIGNSAFQSCSGLTSLILPISVTSIGSYAFYYCSALTSITTDKPIPVNLNSSYNVFYGVNTSTCSLHVPYEAKVLYAAANQWKDFTNTAESSGFRLSATAFKLAADAGTTALVNMTSDVTWNASSDQPWLTPSPLSASGTNTLTLTAQGNTGVATRIAIVTVSASGLPSQTVTITQVGVPKTLNITAGGLLSTLTALELSTITKLLLTGTIDARDFKIMRDNMPVLNQLDISGATIAAFSGTDGTYYGGYSSSYPANTIPDYAFYYPWSGLSKTSLVSVQLPTSCTGIGTQSFQSCTGLTSLDLSSLSVLASIGNNAFQSCTGLTSVTIPASLTTLGSNVFYSCTGLSSLSFSSPSSLTSIGSYAFYSCTGLTSVTLPSSITTIGDQAFLSCTGLTSLNLPSSLTAIGNSAFQSCSGLTSLILPISVTSIGSYAFYYCSALTSITTDKPIPVNLNSSYNVFYGVNTSTCILHVPYEAKTLYAAANQWKDFTNTAELSGFRLSSTAFKLAADAGSTALVNMTSDVTWTASSDQPWLTPSPLSASGTNTLTLTAQGNTGVATRIAIVTVSASGLPSQTVIITQLGIPKTLNLTAGGLFSALTTLERSTITKLVLTGTIDARDFKTMRDNMPVLDQLDISGATIAAYSGPDGTYYGGYASSYPANGIPDYAFFYPWSGISKTSLVSVQLPTSCTAIGTQSFQSCTGLTSLDLSSLSAFTSIASSAFQSCTGLTSVLLPASLTTLGSSAFQSCTGLTSVNIPLALTSIGSNAFYSCTGLTLLNFSSPSSLTSIGDWAFYNCTGLSSLNLPASLNSLATYAFYNCTGLTTVTIPISVNSIGTGAFQYCSALTSITTDKPIPVNLNSSYNVFYGVNTSTCILHVPYEAKTLYAAANQWKDFTNTAELSGFRLSSTAFKLAADAGSTALVNMTSDVTWTASSDQPWLTPSPLSASGTNTLTLTAQGNTGVATRIAIVTVSASGLPSQTVTITQLGIPKTLDLTAGGLFSSLTALERSTITKLVLTGTIDARDFKTMRDNMPVLDQLDISGATIAAYSGPDGTYYGGYSSSYPANGIPDYAFFYPWSGVAKTSLVSIQLPTSCTGIGTQSFQSCTGLTSVLLPASLTTLGSSAFQSCTGLTSFTFPASLTSIGSNAFYSCTGLTSLNFSYPSSLTTIGDWAFYNCTGLTSLNLPVSLTNIATYAFYNCTGLTTVTIPISVNSIGTGAFQYCSGLTSITANKPIPVNLISSSSVFYGVNTSTCILHVPYEAKTLYAAANQWKDFTNTAELSGFRLSSTAFKLAADAGSTALVNMTSDVTWTASSDQPWLSPSPLSASGTNTLTLTAQGNTGVATRIALVTISSPDIVSQTITITQVGVPKILDINAGGLLSALTTLERSTITKLVLTGTIDARDFKIMRDNMPVLDQLDISGATIAAYSGPDGTYYGGYSSSYPANTIPDYAFYYPWSGISKTSLVSVQLPESCTYIGTQSFQGCTGLTSLNIPASMISIGSSSFQSCTGFTSVSFSAPSSLTSIGSSAFSSCTGLTSFTFPASLITIGGNAFQSCTGLTSISFPASLTSISSSAFYSCTGLTSLNFSSPSSLTTIGDWAFYNCTSLSALNLPSSLTTLASYAFYNCTGLTSVTIPVSVTSIGTGAFQYCSALTSITAHKPIPVDLSSVYNVFYGVDKTTCLLNVPFESKTLYAAAVQWKDFTNITELVFRLSATTATVPAAEGSTVTIDIATNAGWSVSSDQAWLTPSPTSGSGNKTLTFTVQANPLNALRFATITVSATGAAPQTIFITQQASNINHIPVAHAGTDQSVDIGSTVTLNGSTSTDADGNQLSYHWTAPDGITLSSTSIAKPHFTAPAVLVNTAYTFSLVVNDGTADSPADQIVVTVKQTYKAPVANAGPDQSVNEGIVVTLDGSASTNTNGNPLTYKWTVPAGITLNSTTAINPWFTAPEVTVNTDYTFSLVVNDGVSDSPADQILVTVKQVNKVPVANAGPAQTVDEGSIVSLNGSASSDPEGDPITYLWTAPAGISLSSTSAVKPDFTAPSVHLDSVIVFHLVVNDGLLNSNTSAVNITVKNLNFLNTGAQISKVTAANIDSAKIDQISSQVVLYLPYGTDPRTLAPNFQISTKATISPASGSIRDFTSPVSYSVTSEDKLTTKTYSVKVFIPTVTLKRTLAAGWNWVSLSATPASLNIGSVFGSLSLASLDYLTSETGSATYYTPTGWFGDLTNLPQNEMMMLKKSSSEVFTFSGQEINPSMASIPVSTGWNRIGYLLKGNAAIGGVFDEAALPGGDILLKSKEASAIFYPLSGWVGDLDSLRTMTGYMLKTASNGLVKYKANSAKLKSAQQSHFSRNELYANYQVNPADFEYSANLIGELVDENGENMIQKGDLLIAYTQTGQRGVTEARFIPDLNRYVFLLTMFSNSSDEKVSFKLKSLSDNQEKTIIDNVVFRSDEVFGQAMTPYPLHLNSTTEIENPEIDASIKVFPNPFTDELQIRSDETIRSATLSGLSGNTLQTISNISEYTLQLNTKNLSSGIYILKIETSSGTFLRKLIKSSK